MPPKRRPARTIRTVTVTRAQFMALRRDVDRLMGAMHGAESLRKECETNLRRCAELQLDIDRLKHLIGR
jgi:hypothetical protein